MKVFACTLCFALLSLFSVQTHAQLDGDHGFLRKLTGSSDCTKRNDECDVDDDCCGSKSVCAPKTFSSDCHKFFQEGRTCDGHDANHDCCDLTTVCKLCHHDGGDCVMADQCCDNMDCVYDHKGDKLGKCKS